MRQYDDGSWRRFCVVGVGSHARTKLIPAILANGQELAGLVSRQPAGALPMAPLFSRLEDALAALPADTAFVLASPPAVHAVQAELVLATNRDLLVEKPAFLASAEIPAAAGRPLVGRVIAEAFMHRYTALHAWWMRFWVERRDDVIALDATFVVPALPPETFRAEGAIGGSSLYDIGCYSVALLGDLGLDHAGLVIADVAAPGALNERIMLEGILDGVAVTARIGVAPNYANLVSLRLRNGDTVTTGPFFYGRPGERRIETVRSAGTDITILTEGNAFRAMLARPRADWLRDQPERLVRLAAATATLERLGGELTAFRATANQH